MAKKPALESDANQLRRRNYELSILNTIARALNRSIELDQALQTGLSQVAELLGLHTGWVWLISEETGKTSLAASLNLPPALANAPHRMRGNCYCLDTYEDGDLEGAANVNVVKCSRLSGLVDGTDGLRYHASIPLYAHEKQLGVLNVASTDWRELSADDLRLLYTIGDLLSIAIERARLFARSAQLGIVEERNRLAREIHDTLAQGLTAVSLQLESADALLEAGADPQRIRKAIRQALGLTRANLEEARRSVLDLRAAPLEGRTLLKALEALAAEWRAKSGIAIHFEAAGEDRPLPVRIEAGLYRIAQEALTNISRHANAQHASLQLTLTPDQIHLIVEDDGQGFEPAQVPKDRYGLIGLNERARLLGGTLCLDSDPGNGTCLAVTIPLEPS
jgi:two-component system NarL family sensor kinase